jgi:hypothetical protein
MLVELGILPGPFCFRYDNGTDNAMNLEKRQNWTIETIMLDRFVQQMTTKETSAREFRIQNAKLQRMLSKNAPLSSCSRSIGRRAKQKRKKKTRAGNRNWATAQESTPPSSRVYDRIFK